MNFEFFEDRRDAGRQLAMALEQAKGAFLSGGQPVILALPRGGVPVAYEVATRLIIPLDIFIVRKLGVPGHEELAMGAVASGGLRVLNQGVIDQLNLPPQTLARALGRTEEEVEEREKVLRANVAFQARVEDQVVILIDDGLATGSTMLAAIRALKQKKPHRIVVAVPVGPADTCAKIAHEVDTFICLQRPEPFYGVGLWYREFSPISDDEVRALLERAQRHIPLEAPLPASSGHEQGNRRTELGEERSPL